MQTEYKNFWTVKPLDQKEYVTVEFYHPVNGVERYVAGEMFDIDLQLEADAPRNAGQVVTFTAAAFDAPEPEQGSDGDVSLQLQLGAIGRMLKEKYRAISNSGSRVPVEVIWRKYLSGVTGPKVVLEFEEANIALRGLSAAISAKQVNPAARSVAEIYTAERFPGLGDPS